MKIELANKKYGIFGIQGSGKTILAKALLKSFRKPIVYRVNDDYDKEKKKVKISYISAPKYTASYTAKDAKKATKSFTSILEKSQQSAKDNHVTFSFKINE